MKKILASLFVLIGCGALFVGCNRTAEQKADYITGKIISKLDLDSDQSNKLQELKTQLLEVRRDRTSDKEQMFDDIKSLLLSEKIEATDVKNLIERKEKIVAEEFSGVFVKFQAFHASLNQSQKNNAVKFLEKFHKKHGDCND